MAKRWYTSDLHLGHERIIELCKRPFESVQHMNESIVTNWNNVVMDEDTVYILGDLAMGKIYDSLALVATLKGNKVLVPGNHDRVHPCYPQRAAKAEQMRRAYEDAGLTIAPLEVTMPNGWKLCHFPASGDHTAEDRYPEYRPTVADGQWLIHGHVHDLWRIKGKQVNVGVDVWNYHPVVEENLSLYAEAFDAHDRFLAEVNSGMYGPPPEFGVYSPMQEFNWLRGKTSS